MGQASDELMSREDLPPIGGGTPPSEQANPSIPELRDEIAETRTEMSGTLDALEAKLSPDALVEQAKGRVRSEVEERLNRAGVLFREYVQRPAEQGLWQAQRSAAVLAEQTQQVASEMPVYLRAGQRALERQGARLLARARQLRQENPVAFAVALAGIGAGLVTAAALIARARKRTRLGDA